jgi:hypothetical protein
VQLILVSSPLQKNQQGTFPARPELLKECIGELRQKTEIIIVSIHAATEYVSTPSPNQASALSFVWKQGLRWFSFIIHTELVGYLKEKQALYFSALVTMYFHPSIRRTIKL